MFGIFNFYPGCSGFKGFGCPNAIFLSISLCISALANSVADALSRERLGGRERLGIAVLSDSGTSLL